MPAWFKARWGTNETLFTLMMNYVATSIVACMTNIMRGQASSLGTLNKATKAGWFPIIMGQRYTINIIVVHRADLVPCTSTCKFSKQGYEISVVGESENTARYAGINVQPRHRCAPCSSPARSAACAASSSWPARTRPSATTIGRRPRLYGHHRGLAGQVQHLLYGADLLPARLSGSAAHPRSLRPTSLNEYAADIITGIILFFILGSEFFINYRLILRGAHKEGNVICTAVLIAWIMRAIPFGTIIMYGALGEIMTEKSGNLNLGVPGIMYLGGFAGFASAWAYENTAANPNGLVSILIATLCAVAASMLGGLIYAFLTISLRANQNVTGLALTTFGKGVANFFGVFILRRCQLLCCPCCQQGLRRQDPGAVGVWATVGQVIFSYGFLVYAAIVLAVAMHWFLTRTRAGLNLRAVGENPATADAAGINVTLYKYLSTCIGAGICGIGGLYYVLDYNQRHLGYHRPDRSLGLAGRGAGHLYYLEAAQRHLGCLPVRHAVLAVSVPAHAAGHHAGQLHDRPGADAALRRHRAGADRRFHAQKERGPAPRTPGSALLPRGTLKHCMQKRGACCQAPLSVCGQGIA